VDANASAIAALRYANPAIRVVARMTVEHYWPGVREAAAAVKKSADEEGSELAWALLTSRGIPRPAPAAPPAAPEGAPGGEPAPAPTPAPDTKNPKAPRVLAAEARKKGESMLKAAKLEQAAAAFETADRLEAGNPESLLGLARAYSRLRDAGRSGVALRRCLAAAKAQGEKPLEKYRRTIKSDGQLSFAQSQAGFAVLLEPYESKKD
ncbi:MAG: hypothetical protein HY925_05515, partial [Elusimicrobia bacterium]|nr:hypothetical protein [Elusimicrobiota bacterium]